MTDACQPRCRREGLAIYPVMYTTIGNDVAMKFQPLPKPFGNGVTDKVLRDNFYALRGLDPGYVYVLYPNYRWAGYVVDCAGYLRYYPDLDVEDMPDDIPNESDVEKCATQSGKTHTGIEALCIEHPDTIKGTVYIAYSRVKWGLKARTTHAAFPEQRMQAIERLDGKAFSNAEVMSDENLKNLVVDFNPGRRPYMNWSLPTDQWARDRSAKAVSLPKAMLAMSGALKVPGLIMALQDPMGLAIRLNAARNRLTAHAANLSGIGDAERARKRVIAEIIEGMRLNAQANPGPWYDSNYGPERYLRHIDQAAWSEALSEQKALTTSLSRIQSCSLDYVLWKESPEWKIAQARDFDAENDVSARRHEELVVRCVAGSGQTACEREKVWQPVLDLLGTDSDNWLARALSGLRPAFTEYLGADNKEDKEYDAVKNATAVIKALTETGVKKIAQFHAQLRTRRAAGEATAALVESSSALLMRLRKDHPQKFNKLIRMVATTLIVRADVVPQPIAVKGTASKVAAFIYQIANVPQAPAGAPPVQTKPLAGDPGTRKGNFGPKALELSEAAGGEVIFKAPGSKEDVQTTVAWVVRKLRSGAQLNEATLRSFGLANVDLTLPTVHENPFLENHLVRLGAKADIGLSAGSVFFQVYSFTVALKTYSKGATPDRIEGGVGMTTAVLSASAGLMEIRSATLVLLGNKAGASAWMLWAGRLSLAAGLIEGAYLFGKGMYKAGSTKDYDSSFWTMSTGAFVAMGGIASFNAAAAGAVTIAAGETTTVAMLGLNFGPVGWTCLALALLVVGLYCSWQAWATDDNNLLPVEYWLDNGEFGKREFVSGEAASQNPYAVGGMAEPFINLEREVQALQRVVMVAQVSFKALRDSSGGTIRCSYQVALPRYDVGTRLEITFTGVRSGQRFEAGRIVCEDGAQVPLEARIEPRLKGIRVRPECKVDTKLATLHIEGVFTAIQGPTVLTKAVAFFSDKPDTILYADHFEMHVSYWPDRINMLDVMSERTVSV